MIKSKNRPLITWVNDKEDLLGFIKERHKYTIQKFNYPFTYWGLSHTGEGCFAFSDKLTDLVKEAEEDLSNGYLGFNIPYSLFRL